ncbi:MAG: hypothetical protein Q8L65_12455, partial [Burkholderiales bacterium]|nr:hypothetical protein [Burkholderiales bacterium]
SQKRLRLRGRRCPRRFSSPYPLSNVSSKPRGRLVPAALGRFLRWVPVLIGKDAGPSAGVFVDANLLGIHKMIHTFPLTPDPSALRQVFPCPGGRGEVSAVNGFVTHLQISQY